MTATWPCRRQKTEVLLSSRLFNWTWFWKDVSACQATIALPWHCGVLNVGQVWAGCRLYWRDLTCLCDGSYHTLRIHLGLHVACCSASCCWRKGLACACAVQVIRVGCQIGLRVLASALGSGIRLRIGISVRARAVLGSVSLTPTLTQAPSTTLARALASNLTPTLTLGGLVFQVTTLGAC